MDRTRTLETYPEKNYWKWTLIILLSLVLLIVSAAFFLFPSSKSPGFGSVPPETEHIPSLTPSPSPQNTPVSSPTATQTLTPIPSSTPLPPSATAPFNDHLIIGTSAAGRPLEIYTFGTGGSERLIIAGIHGGYEWNTIQLAQELISHIQENPEIIPPDVKLYILPSLNPDGESRARGIHGRANENGVDLNRNFPAQWQAEWPLTGCWSYLPISAGSGPLSEPEAKSLASFIQEHQFDALISYHSAALGIFPGGQPPLPSSVSLAEAIAHVSDYPYPPYDLGCEFTGQLIDWTSQQDIPSIDIELTNHQDTDFEQNLKILNVFLNWQP